MPTVDPTTGRPLPDSAIQRILFVANDVHVYQIPPLTSTKGFSASSWTSPTQPTAQQIFTARLRVIETSLDSKLKADIVLEDPSTGDLFAAAPYTTTAVVQQALDSSRFFAVRVQGEGGMKATLGIGFEDRSPAFDFGIAMGEMRKVLEMDGATKSLNASGGQPDSITDPNLKRDFSLKEGQTIHVPVGSKSRRPPTKDPAARQEDSAALFSIAPPPSSTSKSTTDFHPIAPPSAVEGPSAKDLGFDDGEFGEFQ